MPHITPRHKRKKGRENPPGVKDHRTEADASGMIPRLERHDTNDPAPYRSLLVTPGPGAFGVNPWIKIFQQFSSPFLYLNLMPRRAPLTFPPWYAALEKKERERKETTPNRPLYRWADRSRISSKTVSKNYFYFFWRLDFWHLIPHVTELRGK